MESTRSKSNGTTDVETIYYVVAKKKMLLDAKGWARENKKSKRDTHERLWTLGANKKTKGRGE